MTKKHDGGSGTVAVAMSGGVDSSVAAALLKEQGWAVIGITMNLFGRPDGERVRKGRERRNAETAGRRDGGSESAGRGRGGSAAGGGRGGENTSGGSGWGDGGDGIRRGEGGDGDGAMAAAVIAAEQAARQAAAFLGIPFYVSDLRRTFEKEVIADFISEYRRGRTPSPCLRCNRLMKFGPLLRRAVRLGAERFATGHYARIDFDAGRGRWRLRKGRDPEKDQSYFLYGLGQDVLARTIFPIGDLTKDEVRALAGRFGLPAARRAESQEICFIPGDDYAAFLRARVPDAFRPGKIVDMAGRIIGRHAGLLNYTIGQRKGLGIAAARPLYVVALDSDADTVVAGTNEELFRRRLTASSVRWSAIAGIAGPIEATVKIRSRHGGAKAALTPGKAEGSVIVEFAEPQRAVTPGQAAVFYDGDVVLGGGIIDRLV